MAMKQATGIVLLGIVMLAACLIGEPFPSLWLEARAQPSLPTINGTSEKRYWVCPMHPEIVQDHPGTCPICGMPLVLAKGSIHEHGVQVDAATVQRLGVRLAHLKHSTLSWEIRTYGNITADGNTSYSVHSRFDGWINKLHVHSAGEKIDKGQVLYEIYSPELIKRQEEYLRFLDRKKQIAQTLGDIPTWEENTYLMDIVQELSKDRTRLVEEDNVSVESIAELEDTKLPLDVVKIAAAHSGVVTQINAKEGSFVSDSMPIVTLADVSRVWVDIALYPDQVGQVQVGDIVSIRDAGGQEIKSRLSFISPVADNNKVIARVSLDNVKHHLRPGAYADATIYAQPHEALVLPRSAVIYTGEGNMVMLSRGEGRFLPVHVVTGIESGDKIEIVDGLREGAEVAVNGQFLLDAASSMNAAAERLHSGHHD